MPNSSPTAFNQQVQVLKNKPMTLYVKAYDADGDDIKYTMIPASHGTIVRTGVPSTVMYVPDLNFVGQDEFIVTADDGKGGMSSQSIKLQVLEYSGSSDSIYPAIIPSKGTSSQAVPSLPSPLSFDQALARLKELYDKK